MTNYNFRENGKQSMVTIDIFNTTENLYGVLEDFNVMDYVSQEAFEEYMNEKNSEFYNNN